MTSYILDANVAAKWFLPPSGEPLAAEASALRSEFAFGRVQFSVPDLFWPELGNILWKSVSAGRISAQTAQEAMSSLMPLNLKTYPTQSLAEHALPIALSFDQTVYDAIYVVLAHLSNRSLLTADERLVNALGARYPIRWLGSIV